jgi:starch phosphorylase
VLNFSVLDGWWREGYNGLNGWAIGEDQDLITPKSRIRPMRTVFDVTRTPDHPLYYQERSSDGLPGEWIGRMKESIRTISPQFNMHRVLKEYVERLYMPALHAKVIPPEIKTVSPQLPR